MLKGLTLSGCILAASMLGGCGSDPIVQGQRISRQALCPAAGPYCSQTIGNIRTLSLTKEPRYLDVLANGEPNYWAMLGREFTPTGSMIVNFCNNKAVNPLQAYASQVGSKLIIDSVANSDVTFTRKAETRTKLSTEANAMSILTAAGVPVAVPGADIKAAVKAALDRVDKKDITFMGKYTYAYIDPSVLALLKADPIPPALADCSTALASGSAAPIIAAMTLVKIETLTTKGSIASDAIAGLDAALAANGALPLLPAADIGKLKAEIGKKVDTAYSASFQPTYQILSVGGYKRG